MNLRSSIRLVPSAIAATAVSAIALLAVAPLTASAVGIANPVCPQSRANVGIPIVQANALDPDDHAVHVTVQTGSLPAGVTLDGLARVTPYTFSGTPTTAGTSNFVIKAQFEDAPAVTVSCTMTVGNLPTPSRIAGADRYDQAVEVSAAFEVAETVYVASGEKFSDALTAGSVAGVHGAPLLLTQAGALPTVTAARLAELAPTNVVVVGGPASIAEGVVDAIEGNVPGVSVTRIGGADRYKVSQNLVSDAVFGVPSTTWSYVADGRNFPDALAATPPAASLNAPVLLVDGGRTDISPDSLAILDGQGVTSIRIAGGPASVSEGVKASLSDRFAVARVSGLTRYDGAVAINQAFAEAETAYLASGEVFPDALSAGPVAGESNSPIYLVQKSCVPVGVLDDLVRVKAKKIVILGGLNTVAAEVGALKPC
ncbi:cell wall-binding repeat-containing protein [Herbiconiux sp. P18]|uniref:cell wall-binding repeat-containing protein n=1 Tax=Herbiconiux liangxiaofengii TaxID=3342795 RepID=UPI0035B874B7